MRVPRIIAVFVGILFATSFAFAHKVRVDYDHSVNFSKYKTFMWMEKPETENPLMDDRIVSAVNAQLSAKGLEPVTTGADLGVRARSSIQQKQVVNTFYDGWGWMSLDFLRTYESKLLPEGSGVKSALWGSIWIVSLTALFSVPIGVGAAVYLEEGRARLVADRPRRDLFDAASEKAIWRGVTTGSVSDKLDKASRKTTKLIAEMFESYPPLRERISD